MERVCRASVPTSSSSASPHDAYLKMIVFLNGIWRLVEEDGVPVNNVGGGQIAGCGIGPQGEPGVYLKKKKKRILTGMLKTKDSCLSDGGS